MIVFIFSTTAVNCIQFEGEDWSQNERSWLSPLHSPFSLLQMKTLIIHFVLFALRLNFFLLLIRSHSFFLSQHYCIISLLIWWLADEWCLSSKSKENHTLGRSPLLEQKTCTLIYCYACWSIIIMMRSMTARLEDDILSKNNDVSSWQVYQKGNVIPCSAILTVKSLEKVGPKSLSIFRESRRAWTGEQSCSRRWRDFKKGLSVWRYTM